MSFIDSAIEFVDFLSGRGHITKEVELIRGHSTETSSLTFKDNKYYILLSDEHAIYHELAHIILKEDGIEPQSILLDNGAPDFVGHIAGSAVPNFYVNSLLQHFFEDGAPEGVLKGIELYRMDKEIQFRNSMTLANLCSSKDRTLGFYDIFTSLSVARSLQLPEVAISLERLAGEADKAGNSDVFSSKLLELRTFVHSFPDYFSMKKLCLESPLPQAELTCRLFPLLSPQIQLGTKEPSREQILYFIKPLS